MYLLMLIPFSIDKLDEWGDEFFAHRMFFREFLQEFDIKVLRLKKGNIDRITSHASLAFSPIVFAIRPRLVFPRIIETLYNLTGKYLAILAIPITIRRPLKVYSIHPRLDVLIRKTVHKLLDATGSYILRIVEEEIQKYLNGEESAYYFREAIGVNFNEQTGFYELYQLSGEKIYEDEMLGYSTDELLSLIMCTLSMFKIFENYCVALWRVLDSLSRDFKDLEYISFQDIRSALPSLRLIMVTSRYMEGLYLFRKTKCVRLYDFMYKFTALNEEVDLLKRNISAVYDMIMSTIQAKMLRSDLELSKSMYAIKREENLVGARVEILNLVISAFIGIDIGMVVAPYLGLNTLYTIFLTMVLLFFMMKLPLGLIKTSAFPGTRIDFEIPISSAQSSENTFDVILNKCKNGEINADINMVDVTAETARIHLTPIKLDNVGITINYTKRYGFMDFLPTNIHIEITPRMRIDKKVVLLIVLILLVPPLIATLYYTFKLMLLYSIFNAILFTILTAIVIRTYRKSIIINWKTFRSELRTVLHELISPETADSILEKVSKLLPQG